MKTFHLGALLFRPELGHLIEHGCAHEGWSDAVNADFPRSKFQGKGARHCLECPFAQGIQYAAWGPDLPHDRRDIYDRSLFPSIDPAPLKCFGQREGRFNIDEHYLLPFLGRRQMEGNYRLNAGCVYQAMQLANGGGNRFDPGGNARDFPQVKWVNAMPHTFQLM